MQTVSLEDALHLAIAADHGAVVLSPDRGMIEAGPAIGISVQSVTG